MKGVLMEPLDSFTVTREGDQVVLTLMDRYGKGTRYYLPLEDAKTVGEALVSESASKGP